MADLATLSLAIDSTPAERAATALDKMGEAATRGEGRVRQIVSAADTLVAALNRNTQATQALTERLNATQASGERVAGALRSVDAAASTAQASVTALSSGLAKVSDTAAGAAKATDGVVQSTQRHVATTAQATTTIVKGTAAANENAKAIGLSSNELRNLGFQINDVATMALSGASAFQIAATQGGQLVQIATMANGGIRGMLTQAGEFASSAASRIGLVGGALGAVGAALATVTVASIAYNAQQKELERTTFGIGRASGASLQNLNDAASAGAANGTISTSASRDIVASLNSTGKIDPRVYADVAGTMRDLSKVMGTDIPTATDAVTGALSGGIRGFDQLNASLGLGGAALREQIKDLYESGRAYEAQRLIVDAYGKRVSEVTQKPGVVQSFLNRFNDFGRNTSDELSGIGSIFRKNTNEESLTNARRALANGQAQVDAGLAPASSLDAARANVEKLEASIKSAADKGKEAKTALTSLTVQPLIDSLNPANKRIDDLKAQAQSIGKYLSEGGIDKDGAARRTMDALNAQAKQLSDDLASGGTRFASAIREAQFNLKTVGFTPQGQRAADINRRSEEEIRGIAANNRDDPLYRDFQVNAVRERARLEIEALNKQSTLDMNAVGGAFARMNQSVQQQIVTAANASGRIPAGIIAGIAAVESGGNPNIGGTKVLNAQGQPSTSAYGLGQITTGTARDAIRGGYLPPTFDRTDPNQGAAGIAGVLSMKLDQAGGDINKAIANYYGSKDPSANQAYAAKVLRNAGQLGDASTLGQIRDQDERSRALEGEQKRVAISTQLLGVNGEAYDAAARKAQYLADAQSRGIEITADVVAQADKYSTGMAAAARSLASVQANDNLRFDRDQLGRDRYDQAAFARARSTFGDVTTPQATAYIAESRQNAMLSDARSTATDAFTGFATALAHGTSAASAFGNALSRIGDKLLGGVIDSLIGSAFKGGGGGLLSMFGFADGGFTGYGGRNQPAGIVHAGEVVFSQSDVARFGGPHVVNAMRLGYPGYADGGPVLPMMPNLATLPTMPAAPANMNGAGAPVTVAGDTINITPAQGVTPQQMLSALAQRDQQFQRNINGIVAQGQRRYPRAG
ncbi:phage tail length tape measure family protein [Methylobacterium sp. ARG-1]|uniref:phage tail length tape measure family protein n=1 Tax=Methylobacterium sp. ARG-1 TaxID=1692501 RepID=UPI00068358DE|nr:phage tail length tape measure family protein [Methylobacterium sp. ARG-1]KNY21597.1 hypothetical protein AKJ13_15195 [Methylobacterium sp. ARG-1]